MQLHQRFHAAVLLQSAAPLPSAAVHQLSLLCGELYPPCRFARLEMDASSSPLRAPSVQSLLVLSFLPVLWHAAHVKHVVAPVYQSQIVSPRVCWLQRRWQHSHTSHQCSQAVLTL